MPRLIQVIESDELRGRGVVGDVYRRIKTYWTPEGEWLGEARDHAPAEPPAPPRDTARDAQLELARETIMKEAELRRKHDALLDVIRWALGEQGEFPSPPREPKGRPVRRFYWRGELRQRVEAIVGAALSERDAPKSVLIPEAGPASPRPEGRE